MKKWCPFKKIKETLTLNRMAYVWLPAIGGGGGGGQGTPSKTTFAPLKGTGYVYQ